MEGTDYGSAAAQSGGDSSSSRSPVTRAVSGLLMVTGDWGLSVQRLRRDWDVEIVEEGAGERW